MMAKKAAGTRSKEIGMTPASTPATPPIGGGRAGMGSGMGSGPGHAPTVVTMKTGERDRISGFPYCECLA